jgi:hypothetical protein
MDTFTKKIDKILENIKAGETVIYNSDGDHEEEEEGSATSSMPGTEDTQMGAAATSSNIVNPVDMAQQLATKAKNPQAMQAQTQMHAAYTKLMQGLAQKLSTTAGNLNKA